MAKIKLDQKSGKMVSRRRLR